jgi:CheY-like chemotaxis protein/PAS domain-containing protein
MNDLLEYLFPLVLFLVAVVTSILLLIANLKRKKNANISPVSRTIGQPSSISQTGSSINYSEPLPAGRDLATGGHLSTLSEVVFANDFDESISAIAAGINRKFKGSVFIFRRNGETAGLVAYSSESVEKIVGILFKAGLKLDVNNIPLQKGRAKVFELPYGEFDNPFQLIGDMTTTAACKKIQHDLHFDSISTSSVKTELGDYLILLLQPKKVHDAKQKLEQFSSLLKIAGYLANLKTKLAGFENSFDEQLIEVRNELKKKESIHLLLFNDMPMVAAVLDERGVITEASERLQLLFSGTEAIGQPLSSIMDEEDRRNFIELLLNLPAAGSAELSISLNPRRSDEAEGQISDKYFRALLVKQRESSGYVVYFIDENAGMNLKREFERTIDMLRAQNGFVEKILGAEKKYSEEIVRNAGVPTIVVSDEKILFASESAKTIFRVSDNQPFAEFVSLNDISTISTSERTFEATASGGKTFIVSQWESEPIPSANSEQHRAAWFYTFNDVTELKRVEAEVRKMKAESGRLFNSLLPTARVRNEKLVEWNDVFESLFKTFLETDKSFDSFLRYLGESPEVCKSEMRLRNIIMRNCRTTDRKFLNMSAALTEDSVLIFIEDVTEQENIKMQLRSLQNTFRNALESFSEEPIFVVENGNVSASNLAARNKLDARLDEPFNFQDMLKRFGVKSGDAIVELDGKFFRIEDATSGNLTVYQFRRVTDEVAQSAEINILKKRQDLLSDLSGAEGYEDILTSVNEILKNDGTRSVKLVGTGIMQNDKESADVYLLTTFSGKIEPSLLLSLSPADISVAERGGSFSQTELSDTIFSNVLSAGDSALLIQTTKVSDARGFASIAVQDIDPEKLNELGKLLKIASSVAVGIHTRSYAERKFEESGKVTRALIGLTGIDGTSFAEISRNTVDLLKQVFGADAVGVYSVDGATLTSLATNGSLPEVVSITSLKFGMLVPTSRLETSDTETAEGYYFALRSKSSQLKSAGSGLTLIFRFIRDTVLRTESSTRGTGVPPSPSELNAISSASLDLLESKRIIENQSASAEQLADESKFMKEFMARLVKSTTSQDVLRILGDSLSQKNKDAKVKVRTDGDTKSFAGEIVHNEVGDFANYEANLSSLGIGIVAVKCSPDAFSRTMVELAIDKIKSLIALKLPAFQNEAADLRAKLERAKDSYSKLRESVGKIPVSLRNARIGIDGVLSRLSFVEGDERVIQEIKLHLASAAKELSVDLDSSFKNQDDIFEAVRLSVMQASQRLGLVGDSTVKDEGKSVPSRISDFDVSELTEFRADQTTSDLIKDLFVNFVIASGVNDCKVLMMTAQPSPNEAADGKGKHISLRIISKGGGILHDDTLKESASIQTLVGKLEKMGYQVDTRALGSELTMDICEIKGVETPGEKTLSALLVEDDKVVTYEESQKLIKIFSRVKVAADAVEAAMILDSERFHTALVDLNLPSINGRELCRQIKSSQPDCITILLTNREGVEKSDGVDYVMLRPLDEDIVRNYIRE